MNWLFDNLALIVSICALIIAIYAIIKLVSVKTQTENLDNVPILSLSTHNEITITEDNLVIPIYIDTNALLDLLGSMQNGFSFVEKITRSSNLSSEVENTSSSGVDAEFGVPNVLSMLKINISDSTKKGVTNADQRLHETEKYHTYGSLLYQFQTKLESLGIIKHVMNSSDGWETIKASDFVEIKGLVVQNPIVESFKTLQTMLEMFQLASPISQASGQKTKNTYKEFTQISKFINGFIESIEKKNTKTCMISSNNEPGFQTVMLIYSDYLRDSSLSELEKKELRILGKVVRKIEKGSDDRISLMRGTTFQGIKSDMITSMFSSLNLQDQFDIPTIRPDIDGPALEIIPIAIYV